MKEVLAEVRKRAGYIKYIEGHYRSVSMKISISNILYIEKAKRGSRIYVHEDLKEAASGEIILSDYRLNKLYEMLQNVGFEYAHSSYMVNFAYIEKISGCELYMQNKKILTMSRTYMRGFKSKYIKWISDKY